MTSDDQVLPQLGTLFSDWGMTCPTRRDVRWFAAAGVPVYLYRYMRAPNILNRSQGAFHGAELANLFPSVFEGHGWIHEPDDDAVTDAVVGYWARLPRPVIPTAAVHRRGRATTLRTIRTWRSTSRPTPARSCAPHSVTSGTT